jgi:hypothetical protein
MFEHSASDKMQFVGMGDLVHPGACLVCGNGTCTDGYINLGISHEWEGQCYLCWTCVVQTAEIIGCMIPVEVETLKEYIHDTERKNDLLRGELREANERLAAYDSVFASAFMHVDGNNVVARIPIVTDEPGADSPDKQTEQAVTGPESESVESTESSERPSDVGEPASSNSESARPTINI